MANLRILASEEMVGHGHGVKSDTLNRHANVEHNEDGTHKDITIDGQIAFPAIQVPSADANTLDDYEEGTWTPVIRFGGAAVGVTYGSTGGLYTKVGNMVTLSGQMLLTNKGVSVGDALLGGLPFTVKNSDAGHAGVSLLIDSITFADSPQANVRKNDDQIGLSEITNAGVKTNLNNTNFANTSKIIVGVTYEVD